MSQDLPALPEELRTAFTEDYRPILCEDPYDCRGYPNHNLKGRLNDFRSLDIDFGGFPIDWCIAFMNLQHLNGYT